MANKVCKGGRLTVQIATITRNMFSIMTDIFIVCKIVEHKNGKCLLRNESEKELFELNLVIAFVDSHSR